MSFWKQLVLLVIVVLVAAGLWVRFFPGAGDVLARMGLDWLPFATAPAQQADGPRPGAGNNGPAQALVVAQPAARATINDRLTAIGTGRANNSVAVSPVATGRLTEVLVESGDQVQQGDVIARLDADAEEIAVDRARIALDDANARLARITALASSNTVTAVQRTEAELAVRNATLALRDAELTLERRSIRAPIPGVVGIIGVTQGNYVTTQSEILTIEDRSRILVDFTVPERFASQIRTGDAISAASVARPDQVYAGEISAIDNRIDSASRTLRVQARITNPADTLRAGMSFRIEMRFPGDNFPAVSPLAIQWGTDGAYIWKIESGSAKRVPVRIIQRNTDSVLVDAAIAEGEMVVTEGVHAVREGGSVAIAVADQPAATPGGT